jgi:DNA polymerase III sliding clamp (beta) subunit (PCNA family)
MTVDATGFVDPISLSWATVKTLSAKKNIDMSFTLQEDSERVQIGEEQRWVPCEKQIDTLPSNPSTTVMHSKQLLEAIQVASKCVDPSNVRLALGGVCLRGEKSQVLATTGTQLLVQEGFEFSWDNDVICPTAKIFGSKELKDINTDEVLVGYVDSGWIYFSVGEVSLWFRAIDGKFPKVDTLLNPTENMAYLDIHSTDATFLLDKFETLPGKKEHDSPIHMVLNDKVQIRAFDTQQKSGVTLELTHSTFTGKHVSFAMNRQFLKNALQFGCLKIGIDPNDKAPALCTSEGKAFVFMSLDRKEPEVDAGRMSTIVSPTQSTVVAKVDTVPMKRRRRITTKDNTATKPIGKTALLQTAEQIRQDLRHSLVQVNALIKEVKVQHHQNRLLRNTMDSLRKLSIV